MDFRTDLAIEKCETLPDMKSYGVLSEVTQHKDVRLTKIRITNERGERELGKPRGTYITAEIPPLTKYSVCDEELISFLGGQLASLLPKSGTVLTVGLGNENITPDALGPESCSVILATRHISAELAKSAGLGDLRPSAVLSPGVMGQTGVESAEIIKSLVGFLDPAAVIVIDALAARRLSRLGCTVQMADSGIVPGSGVDNARSALNKETLGVPVISVGIPTVVDALTLANDITGSDRSDYPDFKENMIVTSREIDLVIGRASKLVGMTVNKALQPHVSVDEMLMLLE
ncbi:MAG: GPR endopeptidase [Clostridia bacterium]|nr:GPR endopeptidase [Clostridia bacterium]